MGVIAGAERLPQPAGLDPEALTQVTGLIEAHGAVAQICVTGPGDVFVADRGNNRVQVFSASR